MGHGDETTYVYAIPIGNAPKMLEHLVESLNAAQYKVEKTELDRTATLEFGGATYPLPIYAISNNHFSSGQREGFRPEKDVHAKLKPKAAVAFDSGVWL